MQAQAKAVAVAGQHIGAHRLFTVRGGHVIQGRRVEAHTPVRFKEISVSKQYEGDNVTHIGYVRNELSGARRQFEDRRALTKVEMPEKLVVSTSAPEDLAEPRTETGGRSIKLSFDEEREALARKEWKLQEAKSQGMAEDEIFEGEALGRMESLLQEEADNAALGRLQSFYDIDTHMDVDTMEFLADLADALHHTDLDWRPKVELKGLVQPRVHGAMEAEAHRAWMASLEGQAPRKRTARIFVKGNTRPTLSLKEVTPALVGRAFLAGDSAWAKSLLDKTFSGIEMADMSKGFRELAKRRGDVTWKVAQLIHGAHLEGLYDEAEADAQMDAATSMIETAAAFAARGYGAFKWNPTVRDAYSVKYQFRGEEMRLGVSNTNDLNEVKLLAPHYVGVLRREIVGLLERQALAKAIKTYQGCAYTAARELNKPNLVRKAEQALRNAVNAAGWASNSYEFWTTVAAQSETRMEDNITREKKEAQRDHYEGLDTMRLSNPTDIEEVNDADYDGEKEPHKAYKVGHITVSGYVQNPRSKWELHSQVRDTWAELAEDAMETAEAIEAVLKDVYQYTKADPLVYRYIRNADGSFTTILDKEEALESLMQQAEQQADQPHRAALTEREIAEYNKAMLGMTLHSI